MTDIVSGIELEDIPDLEVPDFMKIMSNLREWRCAKGLRVSPGSLSQVGHGRIGDSDSSDADTGYSDKGHPWPHRGHYERLQPLRKARSSDPTLATDTWAGPGPGPSHW